MGAAKESEIYSFSKGEVGCSGVNKLSLSHSQKAARPIRDTKASTSIYVRLLLAFALKLFYVKKPP
jgi:hypothetical protein